MLGDSVQADDDGRAGDHPQQTLKLHGPPQVGRHRQEHHDVGKRAVKAVAIAARLPAQHADLPHRGEGRRQHVGREEQQRRRHDPVGRTLSQPSLDLGPIARAGPRGARPPGQGPFEHPEANHGNGDGPEDGDLGRFEEHHGPIGHDGHGDQGRGQEPQRLHRAANVGDSWGDWGMEDGLLQRDSSRAARRALPPQTTLRWAGPFPNRQTG